ncbi:MAG TPA: isoprenylcysteine carboxylmethyltransferase family protein, partial [Rectinemataceae bacterium]|nr:isoprenylcysteine carboxylmethyltransferase family protein [Rectinemataceae bacterium]
IGGYLLFLAVTAQNSYASRVVEIQEGQRLIDTGLYGIVRHPMYLAAAIMYLATPIALGSLIALVPMLSFPFLLGYRIVNEEKLLVAGLPGYEDYRKRVRYRLIPFIW